MLKANPYFERLPGSYLFAEIARRVKEYSAQNPKANLIRLGIGDVTRPLAPAVVEAMVNAAKEMGNAETFRGYGPDFGYDFLVNAIIDHDYKPLGIDIAFDEVFISDGAKSDVANLQELFSADAVIAVTDPVYPVYVDSNAMAGRAGVYSDGRWDRLHALIGSHDGAKYRNFAQGITFEIMLGHANRQLVKLSDRYILVRDPGEPLSLAIVDAYQAGRRRSTRNLSGGETFIVSLALALGLSTMASRNVRVDSLFLDEGFGSLDADALDSALDTLSRLRAEGKRICAISHLPEVRSRIPAQLTLTPLPNGSSLLSGPGCARAAE